jgi:hypothetical protein
MEEKTIDFTKQERGVIAEYVYGYEQDILITSDGIKLLEVLKKHELIENHDELKSELENKTNGIADKLMDLLHEKVSVEQGTAIMDEYFGVGGTDEDDEDTED